MHLLPATTVTMDEGESAVDLALAPADLLVLSFADSDLSALAAAAAGAPLTLALAGLRRLKHPLSVDLLAEAIAGRSRFVVLRCLGGLEAWRYGVERIHAACREAGIGLAVLPGDDRADPRLAAFHTVPEDFAGRLLGYFQAGGGPENMRRLIGCVAARLDGSDHHEPPALLPPLFAWRDGRAQDAMTALAATDPAGPLALVLVYRSAIAAGDAALAEALCGALAQRGLSPLVLALTSLKDRQASGPLAALVAARRPAVIVTTMGFSARVDASFVLDRADCPVLQATPVGAGKDAWTASPRGLSAADMAMQLALPEFDGRIAAGPVAFKEQTDVAGSRFAPDAEGIAHAAELAARWAQLAAKPRAERRIALVMSDYPARGGRAGFAVGLDTPASVAAIGDLLAEAGYSVGPLPPAGELMPALLASTETVNLTREEHEAVLSALPETARAALFAAHGAPEHDPAFRDGAFRFPVLRCGKLLVALQPARDASPDRKAVYHDPDRPPGHGYLAFYAALRRREAIDALVHLGTHGSVEWLPGKAVALSPACWPRLAIGALPVIYPYVVDDPGEAAPAKRRIAAVTLGHLPPPLAHGVLDADAALLRDLVEDYAAAEVLDPRRAAMVAEDIRARAEAAGLAAACGMTADMPMAEALSRLDAHLCDLGEMAFRDGFHVFGTAPDDAASAAGERAGLLAALDGRFVPPGPAGSPHRGRADVRPTGRNLATLDPRAVPTRAAAALGARAAAAFVRRHLQDEGDYPRRVVMDLWASPTLRSGGEDIAHALALMGVVPVWDHESTRVRGFEILPQAKLDHPRTDVTLRISGAFRDTFPDQIALIDAAARAVAGLDEEDGLNEPAAARRRGEDGARIFGAAPGRFGAGVADRALDGTWRDAHDLGETYLSATSHAYGGPRGEGAPNKAFARRVAGTQAFLHVSDTAGRDILEASSAADLIGGFVAAAGALGAAPRAYSLDTSRPEAPKVRTLAEDIARIVHGRLAHPRWIDGQLRHGWRGGAELAEALDALFVHAAAGGPVPSALFDVLFRAWLADAAVEARIAAANGPALQAIRARFAEARRRGLWTTRLNSAERLFAGAAA